MKALMAIFSTLPKTIAEKYCVTLSGFQAGSRLLKCDGDNVHGANLEIQGLIQHFQKTPVTPQIPLTADLLTSVSKRLSVDNIAASVCTPEESVTALNGAVSVLVCSFSPEDNEKAVKIVRGKPSVKYVPFSPSQSVNEAQFQNIATRFSVVAYIQENEQRVCIKGYVKKDVQAAFGEIKSLMDRQSTICKPIVCSPEQMLYLENRVQHADESTKHVLSSLPAKVIGGNPLCLQGSPEEVERAQKEMMEGPLFQNLKYCSFQFKAHNKFFSQIEQYVLRPLKKECQDLLYIMNDHEKNENREQRAKQGRKGSLKPEVTGFTITIFSQDSATFDCAVAALKDVKVCIKNLQVKHTKAMQHVKEEAKDIERQHKAQIIVHKQSSVIRIFCLSEQEARQCLSELNELISSTVIKKFIPLRRYETNYLKIKKTDEFQVLKRDCQSFKLLDHQKDKDTVLIQVEATIQKIEAVEQELTELIGENFFVKTVYVQCPEKFCRLWEKRWRDLRKVKQQHYDLVIDFKADETEASDSSKQVAYIFTIYGCDSEGGREVESIIRDVDNGQQTVEKTISLPPEAIMTLFKDRKDKKFYMTDQVTVSMYIDTRRNRVLLTSPQTCKDDLEAAEEEIRKYLGDLTRMQKEIPISNPIIGMILGSKEKSFSHLTYANQLAKPHGVTVQCLRPPRCGLVLRGSEESILQVECLIREQVISAIQATLDEVKIIVKPALIPYFSSSDFTHFSARLKDDLCVLAVVKGPNEVIRSVLVQTSSTANYIKLDICKGNLVNETVDAIVNTANESLKHAGGVARALLEAGGETIQRESDEYIRANGELKPGSIVCLGAGNLSCKQLVHAVGPRWAGGNSGEEQTLYFTVMKILTTVQSEGLESVALPAIGTGIFGVPEDVCIQASLKALRDFCQVNPNSRIHHVRFVLLQKKLADKFAKAIDSLGCTIEEQSSQFSVTKSTSSDYNTWLWKNDGGSYIPYSDDLNTKFNDEYRKNPQGIVSFTNNGTIYSIDFSTMIQTNMMTHFKRNVKRSPATNNPAVVQWHYQNDHGIPTPYSPQDSQAIESMYQAKDPGILMISKKQYTFDFNQMCQINLLTSYRRPIDRVESRSPTKEPSHTFSRSFKEEHVVTLHGPQANLPLAKSKMEVKLKSALKKSKIMVPIAMESRIEQIASKS